MILDVFLNLLILTLFLALQGFLLCTMQVHCHSSKFSENDTDRLT